LNGLNIYAGLFRNVIDYFSVRDDAVMKLLILLIGMVLVFEGLPYVAAPVAMQEWLQKLSKLPAQQLRLVGLAAMGIGLIIIWVAQRAAFLQ